MLYVYVIGISLFIISVWRIDDATSRIAHGARDTAHDTGTRPLPPCHSPRAGRARRSTLLTRAGPEAPETEARGDHHQRPLRILALHTTATVSTLMWWGTFSSTVPRSSGPLTRSTDRLLLHVWQLHLQGLLRSTGAPCASGPLRFAGWPIHDIVLFMGLYARINTFLCAPTLCLGTPPNPVIAHTIAQYYFPPRAPVIVIFTTQY